MNTTDSDKYPGQQDTPAVINSDQYHKLIAPYVKQARDTFPQVKASFEKGLPKGYSFFITVTLREHDKEETAFIKVLGFANGQVIGLLATKTQIITSFKYGCRMMVEESEVIDWTITSPDGKEEGNFIGKFQDGLMK